MKKHIIMKAGIVATTIFILGGCNNKEASGKVISRDETVQTYTSVQADMDIFDLTVVHSDDENFHK